MKLAKLGVVMLCIGSLFVPAYIAFAHCQIMKKIF